ncbi:hypothetical protein EW146_g6302 [Bondarzewia mesenterica]|uniref:F-box domain-containing protein n=1 Tax=Bondarzewia mesenterica TaxID=1095465 RepID=A0A4S4LP39_9AGAM|nr:hypothetical protein EW146_g6302 [Bondarzewia mesenterica]
MSYTETIIEPPAVFLRPRPLALTPGSFVLLPLLPKRPPPKALPAEVWSKVLEYAFSHDAMKNMEVRERRAALRANWNMVFVCMSWKDMALPLYYANVNIFTLSSLEKFVSHIYSSDQKWDSIRRIPYSTPGRWVQSLDISDIVLTLNSELFFMDLQLTKLFPLLPFLAHLTLHSDLILSNRALEALRLKDGIERLQVLNGLKVSPPEARTSVFDMYEPVFDLLQCCEGLERLALASPDDEKTHQHAVLESEADLPSPPSSRPLRLPLLQTLSLLTIPLSPLFTALIHAPLPSLHHLMITPYDDSLASPTTALLSAHGTFLTTLQLNSPKHWPTIPHPSPSSLLLTSPALKHLSLDYPLPTLKLPQGATHPLRVLTIPRPNSRFLRELEALLPRLPKFQAVRMKNVKWLRRGVSGKALEAGVQGEMRDWRRRLGRKGVRLLDGDWRDPE